MTTIAIDIDDGGDPAEVVAELRSIDAATIRHVADAIQGKSRRAIQGIAS